jgi:Na+-driven multidrug efflux pump
MFNLLTYTINLHFAGQLKNPRLIDGIGLALILANLAGGFVIMAMNSAFRILYLRAAMKQNKEKMHFLFNRAYGTLIMCMIIILIVFYFSREIFIFLEQKKDIAFTAGYFLSRCAPGILASYLFDLYRNLLHTEHIYRVPLQIQIAGLVIQFFSC